MSSKKKEERLQWLKPFSTMGINEERLMKMSEREYQNTKDYLISVGETPDKITEEEDEEMIQKKIIEQLKKKREEQKRREQEQQQQRAHHIPNPAQRRDQQQNVEVSEATRLKNEQDAEYERLVNEYNENKNQEEELEKQKVEKEKEIKQKEESIKQQKYDDLLQLYNEIPAETKEGVSIAVMLASFNKRIMRKFNQETNLSTIYIWVKVEYLNLAQNTKEIPNIILRQPTGEILEESSTKTLKSEGITKNTLFTCSIA